MSRERGPTSENKEHAKSVEFDIAKEVSKNLERLEAAADEASEYGSEASTESIRKSIDIEAASVEELKQKEQPAEQSERSYSIRTHANLKVEAYQKTLKDIQVRLSSKEKRFSQFVHKPIIENVSEIASKTVARPVGIAWGSVITFIGVSISLLYAYRYGIPFNYLLFVLLFVLGYIVATIFELSGKVLLRKKS